MKKKIYFVIICLCFLWGKVYALENKIYFKESDEKLYYTTNFNDENLFMNHDDLVPGKSYLDELILENKTKNDYNIFLKVSTKDNNTLLDNILMKIYIDNTLIYDGTIRGIDYNNNGININDVTPLGKIKSGKSISMKVETELSPYYENMTAVEEVDFNYTFYANKIENIVDNSDIEVIDNDKIIEVVKAPNTFKSSIPYILIIAFILIIIGLGIHYYAKKK